jgi:oligopeptide transport system ATP-binding protein
MENANKKEAILNVEDLVLSFKTDHGVLKAVRNISFDLYKGETLCIVGESGSGKSVTSKAIMGILAANAIVEGGHIYYRGEDLLEVAEEEFHKIRGHKIGMIFQDPLSSLNPIVRIGKQITEATLINSNKLKLLYEDLISEDLIAYKNCLARAEHKEEKIKNAYIKEKIDLKKKYDANADKEEKKQRLAELNAKKAEINKQIKEIRAQAKEDAAPLLAKLNQTKKEAKIKVKEYKQSVEKEYADKINEINAQGLSPEEKKKAIDEAKLNRVNKLKITKLEAKRRALEIMKEVGIPEPEKRFKQYPFEFSGGMRQRIVIAIALTETPEILICDEPTTALDVTIQGQILELIKKIQKDRNLSIIFITHDLGVVANMADRVAVMYAGKIVEYGTSEEIFFDPRHPYTWALLSSIPDVDSKERLDAIPGTPPNMIYPPKGDAFAARSKYAMKIDFEEEPPFFKVSDTHYAATWLLHPNAPKMEMPKIVSERIKNSLKHGRKEAK